MKAKNLRTGITRELSKEEIEYMKAVCEFEEKNNTFFGDEPIQCNYIKCVAGMGMAGMGKCFLKGNNKSDCPQFEDEKEWMEKEGINDINNK